MKPSLLSAAVMLVGLGTVTTALADNTYYEDAAACNPHTPGDAANLTYDYYGVHNTSSTTAANVSCGMSHNTESWNYVVANVYDRHPTQNVCCTMYIVDQGGDPLASSYVCTTGTSSSWMTLQWILVPNPVAGRLEFECSIPPTSSGQYSHVTILQGNGAP